MHKVQLFFILFCLALCFRYFIFLQNKFDTKADITTMAWNITSSKVRVLIHILGPKQMAAIFSDDILICILVLENVWISNKISLKFVPKGPINNISSIGSDTGLVGAE